MKFDRNSMSRRSATGGVVREWDENVQQCTQVSMGKNKNQILGGERTKQSRDGRKTPLRNGKLHRRLIEFLSNFHLHEGPEGVNWEMGFTYFGTGNWDLGNWDWENHYGTGMT